MSAAKLKTMNQTLSDNVLKAVAALLPEGGKDQFTNSAAVTQQICKEHKVNITMDETGTSIVNITGLTEAEYKTFAGQVSKRISALTKANKLFRPHDICDGRMNLYRLFAEGDVNKKPLGKSEMRDISANQVAATPSQQSSQKPQVAQQKKAAAPKATGGLMERFSKLVMEMSPEQVGEGMAELIVRQTQHLKAKDAALQETQTELQANKEVVTKLKTAVANM